MLISRRALCPRCGAPLSLQEGNVTIDCSYCACRVVVERRLRTVEPEVGEEGLRRLDWEEFASAIHCAGCGTPLDIQSEQASVRCASCHTENRIERRLRRLLSAPQQPEEPDCPSTLALLAKVVNEPELADRVLAAEALLPWHRMNSTLARHMPALMDTIARSDARLGFPLATVVGRMLCTEDRFHHDCALEAAREVVFSLEGSRALLFEIGMGPGTGFKLLLDVAQWACRQRAIGYGCTALWAANQILQRHYEEHEVLRQVLLYRVLYLDGPVLGWAVQMITSQLGVAMRYPPDMLLRFVDEAALERPEVAIALSRGLSEEAAPDPAAYSLRLERLASLRSDLARTQALRMLQAPPAGCSLRLLRQAIRLLLPLLDCETLVSATVEALREIMRPPLGVPAEVHALVRERGDSLPEEFRHLYLELRPDCPHLSPLPPRYWRSSQQPEPLREAIEAWRDGIALAVREYEQQRDWADDYARRIAQRTPLMAAATRGDVATVSRLLEAGEDPDQRNPLDWTALMFAAEAGRVETVRCLLERGASPSLRDPQGRTALSVAARGGWSAVLEALHPFSSEADIQQLFQEAFVLRNWSALDWALQHGADPDTLDEEGRTPLILAVCQDDSGLLERLLAADAVLDHQDVTGCSALHHAARLGRLTLVQKLLAAGADPAATDASGRTPAAWAQSEGHSQLLELF
jgi:LSD1 subclass zinc finger protein